MFLRTLLNRARRRVLRTLSGGGAIIASCLSHTSVTIWCILQSPSLLLFGGFVWFWTSGTFPIWLQKELNWCSSATNPNQLKPAGTQQGLGIPRSSLKGDHRGWLFVGDIPTQSLLSTSKKGFLQLPPAAVPKPPATSRPSPGQSYWRCRSRHPRRAEPRVMPAFV